MFHPTDFSVVILILMAATIFMMVVRSHQPFDNNWPVIYWIGLVLFALTQHDSFKSEAIFIGLATGLMLRFEFMNMNFARVLRVIETCVFCYILIRGITLVYY